VSKILSQKEFSFKIFSKIKFISLFGIFFSEKFFIKSQIFSLDFSFISLFFKNFSRNFSSDKSGKKFISQFSEISFAVKSKIAGQESHLCVNKISQIWKFFGFFSSEIFQKNGLQDNSENGFSFIIKGEREGSVFVILCHNFSGIE